MKTLLLKLKLQSFELNDLVKAIEEEFGVTAAACGCCCNDAADAGAARDSFDVELTAAGDKEVGVIKVALIMVLDLRS